MTKKPEILFSGSKFINIINLVSSIIDNIESAFEIYILIQD